MMPDFCALEVVGQGVAEGMGEEELFEEVAGGGYGGDFYFVLGKEGGVVVFDGKKAAGL